MRTQDADTILQHVLKVQYGVLSSGKQFEGVYYGVVLQTDATAPGPITAGNMTFTIPAISGTQVWGPMPYPGEYPPPAGTVCAIGFGPNNQPIVLSFYGFTPGLFHYGSGAPSSSLGNIGDNYMDTANGEIYGPKTRSGWGSGTQFTTKPG